MTREEVIRLAREATFTDLQYKAMFREVGPYDITEPTIELERFAALIEAEVLERAAKVCEELGVLEAIEGEDANASHVRVAEKAMDLCAAAIGQLGKEQK